MHRSLTTAALAAALWLGLANSPAADAAPAAVDEAKVRLAQGDAQGAIAILEASLPSTKGADRTPLLDALREAYPTAIRQAESQGKKAEADSYRDNLEILVRKPRTSPSPPAPAPAADEARADLIPLPSPKSEPPRTDPAVERAVIEPSAAPESLPPLPAVAALDTPPPALTAPDAPPASFADEKPAPAELIPLPHASATPEPPAIQLASVPNPNPNPNKVATPSPAPVLDRLKAAVDAFKAENYEAAGRIFADLNRQGKLPADLKRHWAYCRAVDVVRRINARPDSPQAWAAIDSEIQGIKALAPTDWYTEYLRNLASERNRDPQSRAGRSDQVVVRGSSPEEPPLPSRGAGAMIAAQPAPAPVPVPGQGAAPAAGLPIRWSRQPIETANFVVIHVDKDRVLAEQAAQAAETARDAQVKRWGAASETWSHRCEIVLFPNARDFARETLQPADSPGFSTMGMNGGRIVLRRVHLRTDHPNMVKAILPHEITHVVLADLFPTQQIPRWADEGMAVLAEPHTEQTTRAADLEEPLRSGRVFRVGDLMAMDYPKPEFWGLYYAQSVSLTRYLVETGSPGQFVRFVQQSQQSGIEPALKQVYAIAGFADLQNRWLTYARDKTSTAALTASSDPQKRPTTPR